VSAQLGPSRAGGAGPGLINFVLILCYMAKKPTVLSFLQFIIINNLYIFNRDAEFKSAPRNHERTAEMQWRSPCIWTLSPGKPPRRSHKRRECVARTQTAACSRCPLRRTLQINLRAGWILVIIPVDFCLLNAVENRIAPHSGKIIPSPFDDRFDLRPDVG
jgi:hypothetical protein